MKYLWLISGIGAFVVIGAVFMQSTQQAPGMIDGTRQQIETTPDQSMTTEDTTPHNTVPLSEDELLEKAKEALRARGVPNPEFLRRAQLPGTIRWQFVGGEAMMFDGSEYTVIIDGLTGEVLEVTERYTS